jgi:hypothetical protein
MTAAKDTPRFERTRGRLAKQPTGPSSAVHQFQSAKEIPLPSMMHLIVPSGRIRPR